MRAFVKAKTASAAIFRFSALVVTSFFFAALSLTANLKLFLFTLMLLLHFLTFRLCHYTKQESVLSIHGVSS